MLSQYIFRYRVVSICGDGIGMETVFVERLGWSGSCALMGVDGSEIRWTVTGGD